MILNLHELFFAAERRDKILILIPVNNYTGPRVGFNFTLNMTFSGVLL